MLNDKIAFLGSNIKNTSKDAASTTIEQRKVEKNSPYKVYVNDKEANLTDKEQAYNETKSVFLESADKKRSIGYFFFKKSNLTMMKAIQKGAWKLNYKMNLSQLVRHINKMGIVMAICLFQM